MPRIRPEGKEYFAEAAKKSRNKRKIEIEKLHRRNAYLEEIENPALKRKCLSLQLEVENLKQGSTEKSYNAELYNLVASQKTRRNQILKEKNEFYRDCQEELQAFLNSLHNRMKLKTQMFHIKSNLDTLLNRLAELKTFKFCDSFKEDVLYTGENNHKILVQSYKTEVIKDGSVHKNLKNTYQRYSSTSSSAEKYLEYF